MRLAHLVVLSLLVFGTSNCGPAATRVQYTEEGGWRADPQVVGEATRQRPQFNYDEARVPGYDLPDPLRAGDGTLVRTPEAWRQRRAEVLELFREHVYGRSAGRPEQLRFEVVEENAAAMDGAATLRRVAILSRHEGREHRFELVLLVPNARQGRLPVFLLLNNRPPTNTDPTRQERSGFWPAEEVIARGYGIAAIQNNELAPDDRDRFREGVIHLLEGVESGPRSPDAWGALAAWAWGASRAMDYFETDPRVDAARVAVLGHSRGGKAALWAGAEDERFALVISNESGAGGAALSRRRFGETVARINRSFPHWFADNFKTYGDREEALPVDQHMLIALIAPRAVYVASADEDLWADPRGEFLSLAHASPVFDLWGDPTIAPGDIPPLNRPLVAGLRGYHVRSGGHNLTPFDWERFLDFADHLGWGSSSVIDTDTARIAERHRERVILLHDNDLHFTSNHRAAVRAVIDEVRRENANVFLLNAGDLFVRHEHRWPAGSDLDFYAAAGGLLIEQMNDFEYDVATLGNHEFDLKGPVTTDLLRMARFPLLAANIEVLDTSFVQTAPYTLLETTSGLRLGVIGLSTINFPTERFAAHDPVETFARHRYLRDQVNALIALTHIGFFADLELARHFPDLDVIIGGHSHTLLPEAILVSGALVAQAGGHPHEADPARPMHLGKVILEFDDGVLVARCGRVIRIDATGARPATRLAVATVWVPQFQCADAGSSTP